MHFTSLDTFISLPKSLKNRSKSMLEATSCFFGSPERFSLPFWEPKFRENLLKIIPKPTYTPKVAQRWPKMMPRCFQRPPRGSKTPPQVLQRAFKRLHFGSTKLSRQPFSTPIQDSQLTIRSLQLTRSTIISMALSRQLLRPQCKIYTS